MERIERRVPFWPPSRFQSHEVRATAFAFACNFMLMASYYLLRPVRDAMATVFGVDHLGELFTGTLVLTTICSPVFAWATDRFKLSLVLPGVFGFLIINLVGFSFWFANAPDSRLLAAVFYWWFSVVNLFMVSVFWSLVVDTFTPEQSSRLLPRIAAGGSLGAIAGPLVVALTVRSIAIPGIMMLAAAGLLVVILLVRCVINEKRWLQATQQQVQDSSLEQRLSGGAWDGFRLLLSSKYQLNQALFILMMTWTATVGYFLQTEMVAAAFDDIASRTRALADIDLIVNVASAAIAMFGLGRFITRFGVTAGLVLNPVLVAASFVLMVLSPTLIMLQAMQAVRRVTQYAIARPTREICFTVVDQESRYKTKNVIDVLFYRLGDVSSAWVQTGMRWAGLGTYATLGLGVIASGLWAVSAWTLGRQYENRRRRAGNSGTPDGPSDDPGG